MEDSRRFRRKYGTYLRYRVEGIDGKYVYVGPTYTYGSKTGSYASFKRAILFLACVIASCTIGSSFLRIAGSSSLFQTIPYMIEFFSVIVAYYPCIKIAGISEPFDYDAFVGPFDKITHAPIFQLIGMIGGFGAIIAYVIIYGFEGKVAMTLLYLVLKIVAAVAAIFFYKIANYAIWDRKEGPMSEKIDAEIKAKEEAEKAEKEKNIKRTHDGRIINI